MAPVYATAGLIAGAARWLVQRAVVVLIVNKEPGPYDRHEPAAR
jgi:hypothetical protein